MEHPPWRPFRVHEEGICIMKLKYSATVTYTTGGCTGAVVRAEDQREAWSKLLAALDGGANVQAIQLGAILADGMEAK